MPAPDSAYFNPLRMAILGRIGGGGLPAPVPQLDIAEAYAETPSRAALSNDEIAMIPDIMRARARREQGRIDETQPNYRAWPYPHLAGPADSPHDRRLIDAVISGGATPEMVDELADIQGRKGVGMPILHGRNRNTSPKRQQAVIRHFPDGTTNIGTPEVYRGPLTPEMMREFQEAPMQLLAGPSTGRPVRADMRSRSERIDNADRLLASYPGTEAHQNDLVRSYQYASALDRASDDGKRGVRQAVMDDLAERFPEKAYPVGTVVVGGGDLSHVPRRKSPKRTLGSISTRIAGMGAPFDMAEEAETGPMPKRQRLAASTKGMPEPIVERMLAGENVSPKERQQAYRYLAHQQRIADKESQRQSTLAAAVADFDAGRTDRLFRQAVMTGDMQGARALLAARQQEIMREDNRGDFDLRSRGLDLQSDQLTQRGDLAREELALRRALGEQEYGLGRERLGVAKDEVAARERIAQAEQRGSLSRLIAEGNLASIRDAQRFGMERTLLGDRAGLEADRFTRERQAASESAKRERDLAWQDKLVQAAAQASPSDRRALLRDRSLLEAIRSGEPTPAGYADTQPPTARGKLLQSHPELVEDWDAKSGDKSLHEFLMSVPLSDIRNNRPALKAYIEERFPSDDADFALRSYFTFLPSSLRKITDRREALGLGAGYMPFFASPGQE